MKKDPENKEATADKPDQPAQVVFPDFITGHTPLGDDFDTTINKLAARGPVYREFYETAAYDFGLAVQGPVGKLLGRAPKEVLPILGPDMHTGYLEHGGAILFVDTVEGGSLTVNIDQGQGKTANYKARKATLVLMPQPTSYMLAVAQGHTRTAILFV